MPETVILVPGDRRADLLTADEGLRIQHEDCDTWSVPVARERDIALQFLQDEDKHYKNNKPGRFKPSRRVGHGRIGWNKKGLYWHSGHLKRFFGMTDDKANVLLLQEAGPAVPEFNSNSGGGLLGALATHITSISAQVRQNFLQATFQLADRNNNGKLSRPELGTMMRKILVTMSSKDVEDMMQEADSDGSGNISYTEFVQWLDTKASDSIKNGLQKNLSCDADLIKATFRLWDKDGDGSVRTAELFRVLSKQLPGCSEGQVRALVDLLDVDDDDRVDYEEFIEFLFVRK